MPPFRRFLIRAFLLLVFAVHASAAPMRPAHGQHAMVSSVHELASQAGVTVLQQGGNAVDAAVAVGFALAVVHPQAGNIGGGGFMLFRAANGDAHFVDYREKAPARATATMYLDQNGKYIPNSSTVGYKAIAVPGSVAGMAYSQKRWGKLSLAQVMAPALRLARDGWALSYEDAQSFHSPHLAEFPDSRRIFQRDGSFYQPGEVFRQPELARTLERIAQNPDDFYHGELAREIAAAMAQGSGLITAEDLAAYEVKERQVVRGSYRGYDVISAPPPSSGGVALIEALNILEGYDLARSGNRSADSIHLVTEAFRRAFYDRAEFMGDPDFAKVPVAQLIDKKYGIAWRESIEPQRATLSAELHRPAQFSELDRIAKSMGAPAAGPEPEHTTHYSIVDADGNAVAVTTTLNGSFGSYVTAHGLGFLLNNEMDDFAPGPGIPNMYGLIQGPANFVGPGKRPLSAMAPTILLKDGKLFLVIGSPGGPRIISTVMNILLGVVDWGQNIQEAVNAPRFHNQWMPDTLYLERDGFSPDTVKLLEGHGYKISFNSYWSDGECIMVDPKTGERLGASDGRNNGKAVGY
ncbi:MAG: gamma-glutamyltransferase [Acidobacteria bacterium]|nr:gamma-glutamyltransferase [Acidobacteriota bacterium]